MKVWKLMEFDLVNIKSNLNTENTTTLLVDFDF